MKILPFCLALVALSGPIHADTYRSVAVSELTFEAMPEDKSAALSEVYLPAQNQQRLALHLPVEAYLSFHPDKYKQGEATIVYRVQGQEPVRGMLNLFDDQNPTVMVGVRIVIAADKGLASSEEAFIAARKAWAERLASRHYPGAAWFRHVAGKSDTQTSQGAGSRDLESTFEIFSGGQAISENLALDRDIILAGSADENVKDLKLSEIPGVTVKAIDWKSRLPKAEVAVDALAASIPADQHALFAPSLPGLLDLLKRVDGDWMPLLQSVSVRNPYRSVIARYRAQLGLDFPDLTARLLPVRSVAITGGDLYFATGTDVAILMESDQPQILYQALAKAIGAKTKIDAKEVVIGDVSQVVFISDDGKVSSHLLRSGRLVVVSNSKAQIQRLMAVSAGQSEALGATDEFRFFRNRYPLAEEESAFAFLSDATIRRWAGPELRIGASRRNRALAALNEMSAREISSNKDGDDYNPLLGRVKIIDGMAHSEWFGSAGFLTPISELGIESVTPKEKEAYLAWRRGYESGWSQVFDPIAVRLKLSDNDAAVDLTLLPLRGDSSYRQAIDLAGKAELPAIARTRHVGSILRLAMAIDSNSKLFKEAEEAISTSFEGLKVSPLSWLGDSVSLDLERSLLWERDDAQMDQTLLQAPVCLRVGVKNRVHLGLVITALRAEVEKSMPDVLKWTPHKEGEQSYVIISQANPEEFEPGFQLCYAIMPNALLVTLDLHVLKKAIEREQRTLNDEQLAKLPKAKSLIADLDPKGIAALANKFTGEGLWSRASQSWRALPILNELRRLFPDQDPVAVHARHFGSVITCPGGKGYRWNEQALTMESVAYGYPAAPREEGEALSVADRFQRVSSGIDFEGDGLRLRLQAGSVKELLEEPASELGPILAKAGDLMPPKTGRVLHYSGKGDRGNFAWTEEVATVEQTEKGIRFITKEPWTQGDESGVHHGTYQVAGDVHLTSWKDDGESPSKGVYSVPRLMMPAELRVGAVHSSEARNQLHHEEEGKAVIDDEVRRTEIRVLGLETVEVPAGTYKDCVKIEFYEEVITGDYFHKTLEWRWYQPGIGLVKSVGKMGEINESGLDKIVEIKK